MKNLIYGEFFHLPSSLIALFLTWNWGRVIVLVRNEKHTNDQENMEKENYQENMDKSRHSESKK